MAKAARKKASAPPKKKARTGQIVLAVVVLAAMVGAFWVWSRGSSNTDQDSSNVLAGSPSLSGRLVLPAMPRHPRPVTIDPAFFTDPEVRRAYQAAKDTPQALEHVACYCGCFANSGHRNNLDCFHDNHGAT